MKASIRSFLKKIFPKTIFFLITSKPKLRFVDSKTAIISRWNWKMILQGDHHRGSCELYLKRKYSHIIDKGLQAPDAAPGHGAAIAHELSRLNQIHTSCDKELEDWSRRIERDYYDFQHTGVLPPVYSPPYDTASVAVDTLIATIKSRRSIRAFREDPVPSDLLETIFGVLNWAPNSCNRQAIKSTYVSGDVHKIKSLMALNSGATCMDVAPVFACITFDSRGLILPTEREVAYLDAGLGLQNAILAAHAIGIGSCVLNWTHAKPSDEIKLRELLGLDDYQIVVANMVLGYPRKGAFPPPRADVSDYLKRVC